MKFVMEPWHLLLLVLAGMMDRQQRQAIEYLRTENSVLKEKLGKRRILLRTAREISDDLLGLI